MFVLDMNVSFYYALMSSLIFHLFNKLHATEEKLTE